MHLHSKIPGHATNYDPFFFYGNDLLIQNFEMDDNPVGSCEFKNYSVHFLKTTNELNPQKAETLHLFCLD